MSILKTLAGALTDLVKDHVKLRSLRKEDLNKLLQANIEGHERLNSILSTYGDNDMKNWVLNKVRPALQKAPSASKKIYDDYVAKLSGKASSSERSRPLGSLRDANNAYASVLKEIKKSLDKLVEGESVTIYNVRMSHIAIFGIIKQSNKVLNFSSFLYTFMLRLSLNSTENLPRYREKYLVDNVAATAKFVSDILNKQGPYNFLQEVDTMRKKHTDMVLGATGSFNDVMHNASIRNFSVSFLDNIAGALSHLNIFSAALDAWDDYQLSRYERNKEEKEWLDTHVALLRLDLNDTDRTSPDYIRLMAIIEAYDQKIAEYDKKINQFEQEG